LYPPNLRNLLALCLYEVAYFLAYRYGMSFRPYSASPFWFPDSVLLCALLVSRPRNWWIFLLAPLPIRLFAIATGQPLWFLLITFSIDSAKGLAVVAALRRFLENPLRFRTVSEYLVFCIVAVLLVPGASAFAGAAARQALGYDYWAAWQQWFLGDAAAYLIVTPAILYGLFDDAALARRSALTRWKESSLLAAGLILSAYVAFWGRMGEGLVSQFSVFAPVPFLLWAAIRFGMFGASAGIVIMALTGIEASLRGGGRFYGQSPAETALILQNFLISRAVPLYLVAVLIEQKNRIENSLREGELRFRTVADSAPVLIWMAGTDKLCTFVNQGWLELTGRTLEQELGDGWATGLHPEDAQRSLKIYRTAFDAREPFTMEYRVRRYDGEYRWVLAQGRPRYHADGSFAGYVGSAVDITERREQELALRKNEELYREVVESQTELVCRYLPDATITFVNEAYCRFFGRKREWLIGRKFAELLPPGTREEAMDKVACAAWRKTPWSWDHEVMRPGGGLGWHHWVNHPILAANGEVEEFQAIGHDITDRKRAEALALLLTQAQEEERKRIARDLHDDFNQRLAAHAIALSNLRRNVGEGKNDDLQLVHQIGKLQEEAMVLGEEIRLIAHELHPPSIEHEGLEAAMRSFCREFSALTNLRVRLEFEGKRREIPPPVTLCCFRIVQEGLRNVVKHAHATEAQVKIVTAQDRLFLTLADNGIGLEGHNGHSEGGLGMSSMRERVELLSGEFHIGSRAPNGTIVMVVLPL